MTPFEQAILQEWRESLPAVLAGDDPLDEYWYLADLYLRVLARNHSAHETAT